ncbi:hypothetical protein [Salmonirosea aquatica]|uniref:hypothetical protein n=1 Tax=Salmonirosea aquatica TaxID=2654236 RepID=UPI0035715394
MVTGIVNNYEELLNNIGQIIEVSGYRNDYIARKIGMSPANFSAKKSRKSFTLAEMKRIVEVIDNEDVTDYLMVQEMNARKDDETISHKDFYQQMGWK